jgi:HSP20 family molecular chaperone IbpA
MRTIFDEFDLIFNRFTRPVKDMSPYKVIRDTDRITIVVNTLGLSKDDVKIDLDADKVLTIQGATTLDDISFNNTVNIGLSLASIKQEIAAIDYTVKDGLTYVTVKLVEREKPAVPINYTE